MEGPTDSGSAELPGEGTASPPTKIVPGGVTGSSVSLPLAPGPPLPPPSPTRPKGWANVLAVVGIVCGFLFGLALLCVPGIIALRSYLKWQHGEKARPLFAWVCAGVSAAIVVPMIVVIAVVGPDRLTIWGLETSTGGYLVKDDFNEGTGDFSTDSDSLVTLEYVNGGYHILVKDPRDLSPNYRTFFGAGVKSISVEADVTERQGPSSFKEEVHGVACWQSRGPNDYNLVVSPDGHYVMGGGDVRAVLAEGTSDAIRGLGQTNHLRLDCVGGNALPTRITGYVNGTKVAESEGDRFDSPFTGIGLVVIGPGGTDMLFDNVTARRLS